MSAARKPEIVNVRPAGEHDQVVTVRGGSGQYRRRPCPGCPWVVSMAVANGLDPRDPALRHCRLSHNEERAMVVER